MLKMNLSQALQPSSTKALIQHADGASRLILHRGPERFTTEFEKSLLTHHISTIVGDTEPCFFFVW